MPDIKLFAGNATPELAKRISICLKTKLSDATVGRFSDGEVQVQINENVRGSDVKIAVFVLRVCQLPQKWWQISYPVSALTVY